MTDKIITKEGPENAEQLNVRETLMAAPFTKIEANYREPTDDKKRGCGSCRFFLREGFSKEGRCQVVLGTVTWFGLSNLYISAQKELEASLEEENAYTGDGKKRKDSDTQLLNFGEVDSAIDEHFTNLGLSDDEGLKPEDLDELKQLGEEAVAVTIAKDMLDVYRTVSTKEFGLNEEGVFDPDVAELHTMLYGQSVPNMMKDVFLKAKLSTAARNDLPDNKFACILPGGKKDDTGRTVPRSLRRLPINDKARVRNALARIPQMLKRGGVSARVARCGMVKVRKAARRMGIGKPAMEKKGAGIWIFKDLQDNFRWWGWVSSNHKDRDGDILTEAAHKEYIQFLNQNPKLAPEFRTWHIKGTARKHHADWWDYQNGFLLMSGKLTSAEAGRLMKAQHENVLGMSHGFFALERDAQNEKHITKYRTFEVSDLPLQYAANPFTNLSVLTQGVQHE